MQEVALALVFGLDCFVVAQYYKLSVGCEGEPKLYTLHLNHTLEVQVCFLMKC